MEDSEFMSLTLLVTKLMAAQTRCAEVYPELEQVSTDIEVLSLPP